jgi:hypothetical protein
MFSMIFSQEKTSTSWQHILWTNCKACIPHSIQQLANSGFQVRELTEEQNQLQSLEFVNHFLEVKQFGLAVDILREDIINAFGGVYLDLNFRLAQSPEKYMGKFDFIGISGELFNENYMFVAKPHHPIVKNALKVAIEFSTHLIDEVEYVEQCNKEMLTNHLTWRSFAASSIFHANEEGNIDIVISNENNRWICKHNTASILKTIQAYEDIHSWDIVNEYELHKKLYQELLYVYNSCDSTERLDLGLGYDDKTEAQSWNI